MSSKHRSSRQSERASGASESTTVHLSEGLIVDGSRGLYVVETPNGALRCTIRGRLRKELEYGSRGGAGREVKRVTVREHDPVAIGDRVRVLPTGGESGVIEQIVARAGGAFTRRDPNAGAGNLSLTTIAGLDQLIAVFAAREPAPHLRLLDRLLVLAESQDIAAMICLNKVDQQPDGWLLERMEVYRAMGYPVVMTSANTGAGVSELRGCLVGRVSAFVGPSGVGKSSLLNAVQPGLALRVSAIGETTHKGRHTTTGTRLVPLDGDSGESGYIADTAGIRALALGAASLRHLDTCFREFAPYLGLCRLADCTHLHEPDCAIRAAVADGTLDSERYESYGKLFAEGREGAASWEIADW
ncbi:MAG TPA: ribosome small subunit-dependent GTPase A [Ktedonobacterales bacterium]|nr:ribosome small subunit-dependent GTPase A [Ktedonobacterales bacterium]